VLTEWLSKSPLDVDGLLDAGVLSGDDEFLG
jgi:hypothetical protein